MAQARWSSGTSTGHSARSPSRTVSLKTNPGTSTLATVDIAWKKIRHWSSRDVNSLTIATQYNHSTAVWHSFTSYDRTSLVRSTDTTDRLRCDARPSSGPAPSSRRGCVNRRWRGLRGVTRAASPTRSDQKREDGSDEPDPHRVEDEDDQNEGYGGVLGSSHGRPPTLAWACPCNPRARALGGPCDAGPPTRLEPSR
jgi:hypothetical protein